MKPKVAKPVRRPQLRFVLVFTAIAGVLLTIYSFPYAEHGLGEGWFTAYLALYARLAGAALRLWDSSVTVNGIELTGRTSLTIAKNCDAMDVNILFGAAVLAFPAAWSRRVFGLVFGIVALIFVNVIRIVSLYIMLVHWHSAFEFAHAEVWPLAFVLIAVLMFLLWSRWAVDTPQHVGHGVN